MRGSKPPKDPNPRTRPALELLRVLRPYTRPHRKYAIVIAVCLLLGLPLAWLVPVVVQRVFDVAVPARDTGAIVKAALVLGALTYLQAVLAFILGYVQSHETGEFMSRLLDDVANLSGLMADRLASAVNAAVQVLVVGAILVIWEWRPRSR
jgi:ABC-type multidrug transport system fused ATPase/permease subunit